MRFFLLFSLPFYLWVSSVALGIWIFQRKGYACLHAIRGNGKCRWLNVFCFPYRANIKHWNAPWMPPNVNCGNQNKYENHSDCKGILLTLEDSHKKRNINTLNTVRRILEAPRTFFQITNNVAALWNTILCVDDLFHFTHKIIFIPPPPYRSHLVNYSTYTQKRINFRAFFVSANFSIACWRIKRRSADGTLRFVFK